MEVKSVQIHKRESGNFSYVQDKIAIAKNGRVFSLADGTTQGFMSGEWAHIITNSFVENPVMNPSVLIEQFHEKVDQFKTLKVKFHSNPSISALQRSKAKKGAAATFIGLSITEGLQANVISCGDSNLFLKRSDQIIMGFPYERIEELDSNSNFINTEKLLKGQVNKDHFQVTNFHLEKGDIIFLATDALSRLILEKRHYLKTFSNISDFSELHDLCLELWRKKELEEDDISALIINVVDNNLNQEIIPPPEFSFALGDDFNQDRYSFKPKQTESTRDMKLNEKNNEKTEYLLSNLLQEVKKTNILLLLIFVVLSGSLIFSNFKDLTFGSEVKPKVNQLDSIDLQDFQAVPAAFDSSAENDEALNLERDTNLIDTNASKMTDSSFTR